MMINVNPHDIINKLSNPSNFLSCLNLLLNYNNLLLNYNDSLLDYNNPLPDYNNPIIIYFYYNPRINNPSCPDYTSSTNILYSF